MNTVEHDVRIPIGDIQISNTLYENCTLTKISQAYDPAIVQVERVEWPSSEYTRFDRDR